MSVAATEESPGLVSSKPRIDWGFTELASTIVDAAAHRFAPLVEAWGDGDGISPDLVAAMADENLFAHNVPTRYGGVGGDDTYCATLCSIREALGYACTQADLLFAVQGLGTYAILRFGTDEQRQAHLPELVAGHKLFAFGLSEPHSGSDVLGMRTAAQRNGDGWLVNGRKMWTSHAPYADVYVVVARIGSADDGSRATATDSIAFLVEKGTQGFEPTGGYELMAPHPIGYLNFDDCWLPDEAVIGEPGEGLRTAFQTLEVFRPSVGALAVGTTMRALDLGWSFLEQRKSFGRSLIELEPLRLRLADIYSHCLGARALVGQASELVDAGRSARRESAMAKLYATEVAQRAIYQAQQFHGGRGVVRGFEIERLFREARGMTIYEGTSEIQREIVAREEVKQAVSQG